MRTDTLRDLEHEVGVLIRRVRRVIHERASAVHPDLQPASYLMLSAVVEQGPVRASTLAELFDIDKGAISRQVKQLHGLGLVEATPDPADGRAQLLTATADARSRIADLRAHRAKWVEERLADWSDDDLATFVADLGRYNELLSD